MNLHEIANEIKSGNLVIVGASLLTRAQHEAYKLAKKQSEYYDMLQGVRKILL